VTFGQRLKSLRMEKNMRQEDLAGLLKVHRATVGKYETEERFPDKATLFLLSDFFQVSVDYLLGRCDIQNPYGQEHQNSLLGESVPGYNPCEIDLKGLPKEAVQQIEDFIRYIRQKYNV
jgi:transcriptional regulator with XRE-family HTH domain